MTNYGRVLVLDTQIVLEGRPIEELPWHELAQGGSVLLVCTPTMLAEVDRHKRDGRVGPRARRFNRLIEPCISQSGLATLVAEPRVDLLLAAIGRIPWETLDDLDPASGDDRIVAEALNARVSSPERLTMFSYDARPRAAAARHGLEPLKPPESWLLPVEPSPEEKESQRLRQRVRELEATQPALVLELSPVNGRAPRLVRVGPPPGEAAAVAVERHLRSHTPEGDGPHLALRDFSYDDRYEAFEQRVRSYAAGLAGALEELFGQIVLELTLRAEGSVGAERLDVELEGIGLRLHDRFVFGPALLPGAPEYRPGNIEGVPFLSDLLPVSRSRSDVVINPSADRSSRLRLTCEDFRHGRTYSRRLYATLDPHAAVTSVRYRATAANLRGDLQGRLILEPRVEEVAVTDLLDLDGNRLVRPVPLAEHVSAMGLKGEGREELDFTALASD